MAPSGDTRRAHVRQSAHPRSRSVERSRSVTVTTLNTRTLSTVPAMRSHGASANGEKYGEIPNARAHGAQMLAFTATHGQDTARSSRDQARRFGTPKNRALDARLRANVVTDPASAFQLRRNSHHNAT